MRDSFRYSRVTDAEPPFRPRYITSKLQFVSFGPDKIPSVMKTRLWQLYGHVIKLQEKFRNILLGKSMPLKRWIAIITCQGEKSMKTRVHRNVPNLVSGVPSIRYGSRGHQIQERSVQLRAL